MKAVPDAVLLASIPESESEAGGLFGRTVLNTLEKIFARLENVWKPVGADESFEIVRRRLFKSAGAPSEIDAVCREFEHYYRQHKELFPRSAESFSRQPSAYRSIRNFRPVHTIGGLGNFSARGMLQQMAMIIRHLWNSESRGAMIMPGSLPLNDTNVRIKICIFPRLGSGDRVKSTGQSKPKKIDGTEARFDRFGTVEPRERSFITSRLPRTADRFRSDPARLYRAGQEPSPEDVLKGCVRPYLYVDKRYWFDTHEPAPEMESRKRNLPPILSGCRDDRSPAGVDRKQSDFAGVIFRPNEDIPDTIDRPIIFTEPERKNAYSAETTTTPTRILDIWNIGTTRIRRNRLVFVVPDMPGIDNLNDQCHLPGRNEIVEDGNIAV